MGMHDDVDIVKRAVDGYAKYGLDTNSSKRYQYEQIFEALGTSVNAHSGQVFTVST